ncbi:MAG: GTP-binding protein [Clostridia bacterium]|nr:GTP-binding protein [Clostridia bacterium]
MTKIDIFSGFLGAGKTTLIKKLIKEAYAGEKLVLIENEFGEIGIDGGFMKEAGIEINEMNSGCICCSLVGDFTQSLAQVLEQFAPNRILIEPSGVGKLSDVIKAVQKVASDDVKLNSFTTVADAGKCKVYAKNFGEFYNDQIQNAGCIILSRTDGVSHEKLDAAVALLRDKNPEATIITTPWSALSGQQILAAMERQSTLENELAHLSEATCPICGHDHDHEHHHHHHDEDECHCHDHEHHHHHHDEDECRCHDHEHPHHHHDEDECHCHDHEHHHHHDEDECHCHDHHHHHHADDVFDSWGVETVTVYTAEEILQMLEQLEDEARFGVVLRAKGIVAGTDGWIHFDYVPGAPDVRSGAADVTGRLCVIGSGIAKAALAELFCI